MTPTLSTFHFHSPCLLIFSHLRSPNEQLTSLASFFGYVSPGVVTKYRPRKTRVDLVHRYDRFHTQTPTKRRLISFSAQPLSLTFSPAVTPLFVPTTPWPLPSKMLIPKSTFGGRTGTPFLVKSNTLSDVSPPSIVPPPRGFYATLGIPPTLTPPTPLTPRSLSHTDLSPTLRQNWSPRANWHSAFDRYKASLDAINDLWTLYIVSHTS